MYPEKNKPFFNLENKYALGNYDFGPLPPNTKAFYITNAEDTSSKIAHFIINDSLFIQRYMKKSDSNENVYVFEKELHYHPSESLPFYCVSKEKKDDYFNLNYYPPIPKYNLSKFSDKKESSENGVHSKGSETPAIEDRWDQAVRLFLQSNKSKPKRYLKKYIEPSEKTEKYLEKEIQLKKEYLIDKNTGKEKNLPTYQINRLMHIIYKKNELIKKAKFSRIAHDLDPNLILNKYENLSLIKIKFRSNGVLNYTLLIPSFLNYEKNKKLTIIEISLLPDDLKSTFTATHVFAKEINPFEFRQDIETKYLQNPKYEFDHDSANELKKIAQSLLDSNPKDRLVIDFNDNGEKTIEVLARSMNGMK